MIRQYISFCLLSLILLSCEERKAAALRVPAFEQLLNERPNLQLVDVRTAQEFQTGHLENALLIDMYSSDFYERLQTLNKDQPIAVYCAVGQRSFQVYELLQQKGFKEVYHLDGGIQAWQMANKKVQR